MSETKSFLGTGWSFPISFDDSIGVAMVSDDEDIRQSISILLNTTPGERVTNPDFGCDLHSRIFKPIDSENKALIDDLIRVAISKYEPRIILEELNIDDSQELDGLILIELIYLIRQVNTRTNMVFPFYKLEGTNLKED